jgi:hypothetical protein
LTVFWWSTFFDDSLISPSLMDNFIWITYEYYS